MLSLICKPQIGCLEWIKSLSILRCKKPQECAVSQGLFRPHHRKR